MIRYQHDPAGSRQAVKLRLQYVGEDKAARRNHPAIEVERGQQGFHGVREQRGFAPSSGFLLAAPQPEIAAQLQLLGAVYEVLRIDQMGAQLGELALLIGGEALVQLLARDQLKHGIAQKLHLLVVGRSLGALACERTVGEGLLQ